MTNNIEKLYEFAEVYKCNMPDIDCSKECEKCEDYNPFTPEKQLELIKWLSQNFDIVRFWVEHSEYITEINGVFDVDKEFNQALAGLILELWNDLTDKQRNEVKEILK